LQKLDLSKKCMLKQAFDEVLSRLKSDMSDQDFSFKYDRLQQKIQQHYSNLDSYPS
jgi:hypothetical protein